MLLLPLPLCVLMTAPKIFVTATLDLLLQFQKLYEGRWCVCVGMCYGFDEHSKAENSKFSAVLVVSPTQALPPSARSLNPTSVVVDTIEYSMTMLNRPRLVA